MDWYRNGADVQARLPLLPTWPGHINPKSTYWYLQVVPELLTLAAGRAETDRRCDNETGTRPAVVLHRPARHATPGVGEHHRCLPRHHGGLPSRHFPEAHATTR